MLSKVIIISNIILIIFLILSCDGNDEIVNYLEKPLPVSIISIEPERGVVGELTKISIRKDSENIFIDDIMEINGYNIYVDSIRGNNIYFEIPYLKTFTGAYIKAYNGDLDTTYKLKVDIDPYPEVCDIPVCVKWNSGIKVSFFDSNVRNSGGEWQTILKSDTVILAMDFYGPNEIIKKELVFLNNGDNNLPEFVGFYQKGYIVAPFNDTLRSGLIKLDSWDMAGVISGIIYAENWQEGWYFQKLYFWVDNNQPHNYKFSDMVCKKNLIE